MLKSKKVLFLMLCMVAMLSLVLVACGPSSTELLPDDPMQGEDPNTCPSEPYELSWYFTQGDPQADNATVEAAVNDYLKDKLNVTVKLVRLGGGQYNEKMNAKINAGEKFDLCFTTGTTYRSAAQNGAFVALDKYIDRYMPNIKKELGMDIWNNVKGNDGMIYAVPAIKEMAEQRGWGFRKDIAEKYNIDMTQYVDPDPLFAYRSFDLIKPVLLDIQKKEPTDLQYPIDWDTSRTPKNFVGFDAIAGPYGVFEHKDVGKVQYYYDTTDYKESVRIARDFFQAGLIKRDVLTATDFSARLKEGKMFAYAEFLKPGKTDELSQNYKYKLGQVGATKVTLNNGNTLASLTAISSTSGNPIRVMRFLEMFNSDKTLNNLIIYGVEGKHYKKLPEIGPDYVEVIKDGGYTLSGSQWSMGNVFLNYLTANEATDKVAKLKEFDAQATKTQSFGFVFDAEPIRPDIAAIKTVTDEYNKQIELGVMDYQPLMEARDKRLKEAGVDKVKAEVEKQYGAFMATKGQ